MTSLDGHLALAAVRSTRAVVGRSFEQRLHGARGLALGAGLEPSAEEDRGR